MRAPIEGLSAAIAVIVVLAGSGVARAEAPMGTVVDAPAVGSPASPGSTLRLEAQGGVNAPLGRGALAVVYAPLPWMAAGAGLGLVDLNPNSVRLRYAVFVRAPVVRRGWLAIGPVLTASLGDSTHEATYERPQYVPDHLRWTWAPGYRVDAGLGVDVKLGRWAARVEGGWGYLINKPSCTYSTESSAFAGSCTAPEIPAYYHFSQEPGRLTPYISVSVGPEVSGGASPHFGANGGGDSTTRQTDARADAAWAAPTGLTLPRGSVTITLYELSLINATVGVTDRVQATAGVGWPLFDYHSSLLWDVSIKAAVVRSGRWRLALVAGGAGIKGNWSGFTAFGAGPAGSLCFDDGCASVLSTSILAGTVTVVGEEGQDHAAAGLIVSPSVVIGVASHLKLVGEAHVISRRSDALWVAAARVPYGPLAIDFGVIDVASSRGPVPIGSASWHW